MITIQQCTHCILDTTDDPNISFDANGVCNYCREYEEKIKQNVFPGEEGLRRLDKIVERVKAAGKGKEYDCILGLSGGVDSSYVAWYAKKMGLRPLVIHLDNGWNSELAVMNIEKIVSHLGFDLYSYVINWEEFRDIQLAYLKASVVDIEAITDHAISGAIHKLAKKHKVHFVLSGVNMVTEGILPSHWTHRKTDWLNIKSIHKKFGKLPLKTYPYLSYWKHLYYTYFYKIESIPLLNYVPYNKAEAKKIITEKLGWRDYGGKHFESVFTRFYQSFILPVKFKIDKRRAHLSTLICSGQISREEALEELKMPPCDAKMMAEDKQFVVKKFGMTELEFDKIMNEPPRAHMDYPSYIKSHWKYQFLVIRFFRPLIKLVKKIKG